MQHKDYMKTLLQTEDEEIKRLHQVIADAIKEEGNIAQVLFEKEEKLTKGQKLADKIATFGGSWKFIIMFCSVLAAWIIVNTIILVTRPFDPYPFILLNLILSCIAALQAPVIMMSQNRKEQKDRQRAENDYMINLKAEIEIRHLHQKMDLLMTDQLKSLLDIQKVQIELIEKLRKKLKKHLKKENPKKDI